MKRTASIRFKILFLVLAVTLTSIVIISLVSISTIRDALNSKAMQQLVSIREIQKSALQNQFTTYRKQLLSMAQSSFAIEAMKDFRESFKTYPEAVSILEGSKDLRQKSRELRSYYDGPFGEEFLNRNGRKSEKINDIFNQLTPQAIRFQHSFIWDNPNPLGSKHLLNRPNQADQSDYARAHETYHPYFSSFLERFGYYDIFLVDPETGEIVYSVFKELDYATSLLDGPYADTNFGEAFRAVQGIRNSERVKMVDFDEYFPSYESPASFLSVSIVEDNEPLGVLIFQIPIEQINNTMTSDNNWESVGLGQSGETYIVAEDLTMRNDSRFLIEDPEGYFAALNEAEISDDLIRKIRSLNSSILLQKVQTEASERAIRGETGNLVVEDYRGVPVLSAFGPLDIPDVNWTILSEIDEAEINEYPNSLSWMIAIIAAVICLLAILATYFYVQISLASPLRKMISQVRELELNKSLQLNRSDEIGQIADAIDIFTKRLFEIVVKVKERAADISSSSNQLATGNMDLATRTEQQSSSLEETASAMEEMTSNVQQNAESANHANHISQNMKDVVEERKGMMQSLMNNTIDSNQEDIDKVMENNSQYFVRAEEKNTQMMDAMKGIGESSEKTLLAIIWIAISLSSLLSIKTMFQEDFDDGTLDLYILSNTSIETIIFIKSIVHWITTNLPIITLIPLISFPLGITIYHSILICFVMLLSTPALSFISTIGAALTLGEKGGNLLISIFILPTFLPIIIFGMKISILITNSTYDIMAHLILFALSLICIAITPFITSLIIKIHYT